MEEEIRWTAINFWSVQERRGMEMEAVIDMNASAHHFLD